MTYLRQVRADTCIQNYTLLIPKQSLWYSVTNTNTVPTYRWRKRTPGCAHFIFGSFIRRNARTLSTPEPPSQIPPANALADPTANYPLPRWCLSHVAQPPITTPEVSIMTSRSRAQKPCLIPSNSIKRKNFLTAKTSRKQTPDYAMLSSSWSKRRPVWWWGSRDGGTHSDSDPTRYTK